QARDNRPGHELGIPHVLRLRWNRPTASSEVRRGDVLSGRGELVQTATVLARASVRGGGELSGVASTTFGDVGDKLRLLADVTENASSERARGADFFCPVIVDFFGDLVGVGALG